MIFRASCGYACPWVNYICVLQAAPESKQSRMIAVASMLQTLPQPYSSTQHNGISDRQLPQRARSLCSEGLTGRWCKDKALSDAMTDACDAVALPWLLRKALGLLKVLEVRSISVNSKPILPLASTTSSSSNYSEVCPCQ